MSKRYRQMDRRTATSEKTLKFLIGRTFNRKV